MPVFSLTHFSNGNTTYPNMGLNTGGIRLGLAYYINRQPLAVPKVEREKLPDSRGLYTDVVLYGAWKQGIAHDGVSSYLLDGSMRDGLQYQPDVPVEPVAEFGCFA